MQSKAKKCSIGVRKFFRNFSEKLNLKTVIKAQITENKGFFVAPRGIVKFSLTLRDRNLGIFSWFLCPQYVDTDRTAHQGGICQGCGGHPGGNF